MMSCLEVFLNDTGGGFQRESATQTSGALCAMFTSNPTSASHFRHCQQALG